MARFYFHLWSGRHCQWDETGSDHNDADAAYVEAYEAAQELTIDFVRNRRNALDHRFDVVDEQGRLVFDLPFNEVLGQGRQSHPVTLTVARGRQLVSDVGRQVLTVRKRLRELEAALKSAPG